MYFQFLQRYFQLLQTLHPFFAKCISNMMSWTNHDDWSGCFYAKCILQLLQRNFQFFAKWTSIVCKMCFQYAGQITMVGWSLHLIGQDQFFLRQPRFTPGRWWAGVRKCPTIVHLMTLNTGINIQKKGKLPYILCDVKPELFQWRFSDKEFWLVFQNSVGISTFKHRKNHKSCTSQ